MNNLLGVKESSHIQYQQDIPVDGTSRLKFPAQKEFAGRPIDPSFEARVFTLIPTFRTSNMSHLVEVLGCPAGDVTGLFHPYVGRLRPVIK